MSWKWQAGNMRGNKIDICHREIVIYVANKYMSSRNRHGNYILIGIYYFCCRLDSFYYAIRNDKISRQLLAVKFFLTFSMSK